MDSHTQKKASANSTNSSKIVLYSFWHSSCSWRVRFALNLKGLSYDCKEVNLEKGEQFGAEFGHLNPLHYVPVLVDGDFVVSDSYAILLYLEERCPQKPLLPTDLQLRALNFQAASLVSSIIQPLIMNSILKRIEAKVGPQEKLIWAKSNIEKGLLGLENLLKKCAGKYATGKFVDVFLGPQIAISINRFHIDMSKFPTLSRIYESYNALPEFQASRQEE